MAFMVLGEASEMTPDMVDRGSIGALRELLVESDEFFFFHCKRCGKQRMTTVVDPGVLTSGVYECADEDSKCVIPPSPKTTPPPLYFRPGSLVFAPINHNKKIMWPGIIEPCPDGDNGWKIDGKTPGSVTALFVTFIFDNREARKWYGGFIKRKEIVPFMEMQSTAALPGSGEVIHDVYAKALEEARETIRMTLKERLLKFSFVAHVARTRNRSLDDAEREHRARAMSRLIIRE